MSTQGGGSGSSSRSITGIDSISEQVWEFISSEITHGILEQTLVVFNLVKEGILGILDERLGAFCAEVIAIVGAHILFFS